MSPLPLVATLNMVLPSLSLTIAVAPLIAVLSLSVTRARRCDRKQQTLEGSIKRILF
jgi:Flp pilus assembly protein TadB